MWTGQNLRELVKIEVELTKKWDELAEVLQYQTKPNRGFIGVRLSLSWIRDNQTYTQTTKIPQIGKQGISLSTLTNNQHQWLPKMPVTTALATITPTKTTNHHRENHPETTWNYLEIEAKPPWSLVSNLHDWITTGKCRNPLRSTGSAINMLETTTK